MSPFTSVGHAVHELVSGDRVGYGLHAVTAAVVVVLVVVAARKLPFSYTLYAGASVLVAFCAHNLDSVERYSLATFPLVIAAGVLLRRASIERVVYLLLAGGIVAGSRARLHGLAGAVRRAARRSRGFLCFAIRSLGGHLASCTNCALAVRQCRPARP